MLGSIQSLLKSAPAAYRPPTGGAAPAPVAPKPQRVHVGGGDALTITFRSGNTLWQMAGAYSPEPVGGSAPGAREAMLERLRGLNGGKDLIIAGRTFALPTDEANPKLNAAIAVQKSIASRLQQGQFFPAFDYNAARVSAGEFGSWTVSLPSRYGTHQFHVLDDASGEDQTAYSVFTHAEWQALKS